MNSTENLINFVCDLKFEDIPNEVILRMQSLFLDWLACSLAGKNGRPVKIIQSFADEMGPKNGKSEILISGKMTSPLFAAMVNGASSHFVEQDDVHNGSVFHPGSVIFPSVLAISQDRELSGKEMITASIVGYESGIRIGEFLGRSHYKVFHTTGTVGTLASAFAVGKLIGLSNDMMTNAIGSAGTQASGLWEFLKDAADSKQLHTSKAALNGMISAILAEKGFTGAKNILTGEKGMAAGMSNDSNSEALNNKLGTRWATMETSFKFHASCRHTHPSADALKKIIDKNNLDYKNIDFVNTYVYQGAIDVLSEVKIPKTVHQAKFSMGTVLGIIAIYGKAGVNEFENFYNSKDVHSFSKKVKMIFDEKIDSSYPKKWIGKVSVHTKDGKEFIEQVDDPKGDPENTLSPSELEEKVKRLIEYSNTIGINNVNNLFDYIKNLTNLNKVGKIF